MTKLMNSMTRMIVMHLITIIITLIIIMTINC